MFNNQSSCFEYPLYKIKHPKHKKKPDKHGSRGKNAQWGLRRSEGEVVCAHRALKLDVIPPANCGQQDRKENSDREEPVSKPVVGFVDVLLKFFLLFNLFWRH
jgi:hypothetical protein